MAQDGRERHFAQPPAVAALKYESGVGPEPHKVMMERSFSQDIQEGTQELKEIAEQTRNIILEVSLDGVIRWVSPSWTDVVGTQLELVKGQPVSKFIKDNPSIFDEAIKSLRSNDSKSRFVKFAVEAKLSSDLGPMLNPPSISQVGGDGGTLAAKDEKQLLELEGQGIMVYDRATGGESHTMWMLQPAAEPIHVTVELPTSLVEKLGVGAEVLAKYLTELAEAGSTDLASHPPPDPIVCRVCERSISAWWFEKHSDLCVQEHKAELELQMIQESLTEHRHAIVRVLDAFEARSGRSATKEGSPVPLPEYKGMPIGPSSTSNSARASQAASPVRSRSPSTSGVINHARMRSSFIVRRPLVRIVELILDLCDTAIEISTPAIKDTKMFEDEIDFIRTQSPQSESRISQVLQWQQPSSLDNEPGLSALSTDTEHLARTKLESIHRYQVILEYSERMRQEYSAEVDDCIAEALYKAGKAAAGESLSSSESDSDSDVQASDLEDITPHTEEPIALSLEPEAIRRSSRPQLRSMASALRNPMDIPPVSSDESRQPPSQAVSTGSSSPMECPTPKSHRSTLISQPQPISKRRSIYTLDADDSDSSMPSSSLASSTWRAESPASNSDHGITRTKSSRESRKRRSMHLHNFGTASPHRQQSPARYPHAPPSPLRMSKSRISSSDMSNSPAISPLITTNDFTASSPTLHHRRQSSIHSFDLRTPLSPRLSSIAQPQAKAQPPSIKDFEIIKPISKGAFGSVYLAKKKLTGEYFAIKVLRKSDMVAKNQVTNVKAERAIMMWQGESDFVAKLYWTFSSKEYLFLVMEYLNGGDCGALVKILGGLSEDWAKKYVAEVVLGVEHLHSRGIVHRDLKPDNLLIDSKGHLKLTDFGLSRMGLIGRQKRALKSPEDPAPDLLKQGPFPTQGSGPPSRSASFDIGPSPGQTPLMTPALAGGLDQPSYFSLNRESSLSRELSRRTSGHRSDSGHMLSHDLHTAFKNMNIADSGDIKESIHHLRSGPIEEESASHGSASPDLFPLSHSVSNVSTATSQMLPPPTALFEPEESNRRFVGTPDYLAPETITGTIQDEMCDWWSLGCILFEFMFGYPPFNAESTDEVFDNILHRRIAWPNEEDVTCSAEAKDLINKLIQVDTRKRLGANADERFECGGAEIQAHPWFADINWSTLLEDEAQFIPNPENPEDTEYFDTRGATLQAFPEEAEDTISPTGNTPGNPAEYADRPHDALFRVRTQTISSKRGLMPLHIPPHVARDSRSRRLSEPVIADDFGNFTFKNLPVLEKANKDIVEKMRKEAMQAQARGYSNSQAVSVSNTPQMSSPAPSLEGSPMLPMPVNRALSVNKGHRPQSPSLNTTNHSSPARPSQPSSPMLLQFSTQSHHHERRKTSGSSAASSATQASFFDLPKDGFARDQSAASSPIKNPRQPPIATAKNINPPPQRQSSHHGRTRSQTVGSHTSENSEAGALREGFVPGHHKRKSQLFVRDISPSSSDNESVAQAKALLKVQRKRQSSRRMSQISFSNGPAYRPLDVLVCEDHPVSKMVMERLLEKLRCRSITATTGPDVLRLAISQIQFDIIFMEFKLPLINGVDVARMIRDTKSSNTNTPIVCITGYLKELPELHNFDTLMQKPPTVEKLTEALCRFCSWKPPPKDFKLTTPLTIPPPHLRSDPLPVQNSPSSVASSRAPTMPESSWRGSSREDSIGSGGFFSDREFLKSEEIPMIVSRAATDEWNKSGLGISDDITSPLKSYINSGFHPNSQLDSTPASAVSEDDIAFTRTPRHHRAPSTEVLKHRQDLLESGPRSSTGAEEGDDEDEELGHSQARSKSPINRNMRTASKLGHEMMRTNSRGSVISMNDERQVEPDNLRRSLELLEERMEELKIPEEDSTSTQDKTKISKLQSPPPQSLQNLIGPGSRGHITPPVMFPKAPGSDVKDVELDPDVTPVPSKVIDVEQTPRAHTGDSISRE